MICSGSLVAAGRAAARRSAVAVAATASPLSVARRGYGNRPSTVEPLPSPPPPPPVQADDWWRWELMRVERQNLDRYAHALDALFELQKEVQVMRSDIMLHQAAIDHQLRVVTWGWRIGALAVGTAGWISYVTYLAT